VTRAKRHPLVHIRIASAQVTHRRYKGGAQQKLPSFAAHIWVTSSLPPKSPEKEGYLKMVH